VGRGPKGYRRSDERIHEDVCDCLTDHPEVDASEIEVEVHHGEVTLAGTVESRYAKRLAEDIAEAVSGVHDVHNRLRVVPRQESGVQRSPTS
jgi:osmotically-inducible protein OsmY